jgi:hypothetical protein
MSLTVTVQRPLCRNNRMAVSRSVPPPTREELGHFVEVADKEGYLLGLALGKRRDRIVTPDTAFHACPHSGGSPLNAKH